MTTITLSFLIFLSFAALSSDDQETILDYNLILQNKQANLTANFMDFEAKLLPVRSGLK